MDAYKAFRHDLQRALDIGTNLLSRYGGGIGLFQRVRDGVLDSQEVTTLEEALEVSSRFSHEHVYRRKARV